MVFEYHYISFLLLFCIITVLVASIYILYIKDLRYLIIVSSIGNNRFILLAILTNNILMFSLFYVIYILNTYLILNRFGSVSTHSMSYTLSYSLFILYLFVLLLNIGSFPPMPGFFTKFIVFYTCINIYSDIYLYFLLIIIFNVIMIVSYVSIFFKYIVNVYTSPMNLIVY